MKQSRQTISRWAYQSDTNFIKGPCCHKTSATQFTFSMLKFQATVQALTVHDQILSLVSCLWRSAHIIHNFLRIRLMVKEEILTFLFSVMNATYTGKRFPKLIQRYASGLRLLRVHAFSKKWLDVEMQ